MHLSAIHIGGAAMTKTLIDIDDELLAGATAALGTTTKDTVNQALARVIRIDAFERQVEFAKQGGFDDLLDPEAMKGAWRQ
jgi:Arc/MetJ family transcription regulator